MHDYHARRYREAMGSAPIRDQVAEHLITPKNSALVLIDYQDSQFATVSVEAHRAGLERIVQAGGQPISWVSLGCELQRDWNRQATVPAIVQIVLTERLTKE
jgi:nicotinamidase-related amidase